MNTIIHFIDVGQGNMVLIESSSGDKFICDCNVKGDNEDRVLSYLDGVIGVETPITTFICTHRDADHMRELEKYMITSLLRVFGIVDIPAQPPIVRSITSTWNCEEQSGIK